MPPRHSAHQAIPGCPGPPVTQDQATRGPPQASHRLGKRSLVPCERNATPGAVPPHRILPTWNTVLKLVTCRAKPHSSPEVRNHLLALALATIAPTVSWEPPPPPSPALHRAA